MNPQRAREQLIDATNSIITIIEQENEMLTSSVLPK